MKELKTDMTHRQKPRQTGSHLEGVPSGQAPRREIVIDKSMTWDNIYESERQHVLDTRLSEVISQLGNLTLDQLGQVGEFVDTLQVEPTDG